MNSLKIPSSSEIAREIAKNMAITRKLQALKRLVLKIEKEASCNNGPQLSEVSIHELSDASCNGIKSTSH